MLADDGRVVCLDFGLMSTVEPDIMEAFARGIQAALAEDYVALAQAFKDTGFVNDPIIYYPDKEKYGIDPETGEDTGLAAFAVELTEAMRVTDGSDSRFGALATVLNQELSPRWKMFTPPCVLLLIRTFLTLEGIADRVDPDFNIYEMTCLGRSDAHLPKTVDGIAAMRSTFLTPDNRVQERPRRGVVRHHRRRRRRRRRQRRRDRRAAGPRRRRRRRDRAAADGRRRSGEGEGGGDAAAKSEAMNAAVAFSPGSPQGKALRKALRDVDSTDLAAKLLPREARAPPRGCRRRLRHDHIAVARGGAAGGGGRRGAPHVRRGEAARAAGAVEAEGRPAAGALPPRAAVQPRVEGRARSLRARLPPPPHPRRRPAPSVAARLPVASHSVATWRRRRARGRRLSPENSPVDACFVSRAL